MVSPGVPLLRVASCCILIIMGCCCSTSTAQPLTTLDGTVISLCVPNQENNTLYGRKGPHAVTVEYTYELEVLASQADKLNAIIPELEISFAAALLIRFFPAECNIKDSFSSDIEGIVGLSTLEVDVARSNTNVTIDTTLVDDTVEEESTSTNTTANETTNESTPEPVSVNATETDSVVADETLNTTEPTNTTETLNTTTNETIATNSSTPVEEEVMTESSSTEPISVPGDALWTFLDTLDAESIDALSNATTTSNTTDNNSTTTRRLESDPDTLLTEENLNDTLVETDDSSSATTISMIYTPCNNHFQDADSSCFVVDGSLTVYWDEAISSPQTFAALVETMLRTSMDEANFLATHEGILRVGMYDPTAAATTSAADNTKKSPGSTPSSESKGDSFHAFWDNIRDDPTALNILIFAPFVILLLCMLCCCTIGKRNRKGSFLGSFFGGGKGKRGSGGKNKKNKTRDLEADGSDDADCSEYENEEDEEDDDFSEEESLGDYSKEFASLSGRSLNR
jgi:hypothetical protein